MKRYTLGFLALSLAFGTLPAFAQSPMEATAKPSELLNVMRREMKRNFAALKQAKTPPYFIGYTVHDIVTTRLRSSFGAIETDEQSHERVLTVDVRVGNYDLDNTHEIRGDFDGGNMFGARAEIPLDADSAAVKMVIWRETDKDFKDAVERLTKVFANKAVKVQEEDTSADFSHEEPSQYYEEPLNVPIDREAWKAKLRSYTASFKNDPRIYEGSADLEFKVDNKYYVNTEGSELQTSDSYVRLLIYGSTKADDGMELPRYESFFAFTPAGMPDDNTVLDKVHTMITDLAALRNAPIVDPYTGPAILSGRASGVFFHEVFGHRIEGHRQKKSEEGQTFTKKIGKQVTADFLSVVFDPAMRKLGNTDLIGFYKYDDEGVKGQKVTVVQDGIFKGFLMGRSPIQGFDHSNGHGRCQSGYTPVARQSNLIVETTEHNSPEQLHQLLIDECKKQGKPFGLFFKDIEGGFTLTGRTIPNAFNVLPILVYKVYADGRPDELVRGVDLIGTPLETFMNITASDANTETFDGICGAESGWVPVSASSPALLISTIEVQKKEKSQERLPILPAPAVTEGGNAQ
ncbi:MAG TPA: TldD/PmbA family protein [Candidatus Kapabacteria bacterium]|nr:TldD/PmbA family protein [Candidatus Kapabacteria bacterium]